MMSPLRILMLYRQPGFVQTHALYSIEAPWLPKSESGTRSPSPHLRHRGKVNSKAVRLLPAQGFFNRAHRPTTNPGFRALGIGGRAEGASATASAPRCVTCKTLRNIPQIAASCDPLRA